MEKYLKVCFYEVPRYCDNQVQFVILLNMWHLDNTTFFSFPKRVILTLEESLSITTGRCNLAIATHARKMHKNLFVVVHPEVSDND